MLYVGVHVGIDGTSLTLFVGVKEGVHGQTLVPWSWQGWCAQAHVRLGEKQHTHPV